MAEELKVVVIGAASPQWGFTLSRDLIVTLSDEKFADSYQPVLVMEDIDSKNLATQVQLALKISDKTGARVRVESTTDQRRAISGARFVITSFAQGSLEAMQHDLEIPQEYGIYQPVGDSVSVGGAIRAARNIPAILGMARDMEESAHGDAWLINLSNPMSILCRAVTKETKVRTIGCCHELYGGIDILSEWLDFPADEWRQRLEIELLGINHCAWIQQFKINGEDGFEKLREFLAGKGITAESKKLYDSPCPELTRHNVKINLFLRYGVLPCGGDRHTSEFFTEFVNLDTNKGADYGVLLTTAQERLVTWRGAARARIKELLEDSKKIDLSLSREAAPRIIAALLLGEKFYDVGNLPYHGDTLPGVPDGALLERMVTYDKDGATAAEPRPLPPELQEHLSLHAGIIEDVVQACVTGDRKLLTQALEKDPLLGNMQRTRIAELVARLLDVHAEYVHPGFF